MEYGAPLFTTVRETFTKRLDIIQNDALRCILGARKTSPILSLQVESVIPPVAVRIKWLFMKWYTRASSTPQLCNTLKLTSNSHDWSFRNIANYISELIRYPIIE